MRYGTLVYIIEQKKSEAETHLLSTDRRRPTCPRGTAGGRSLVNGSVDDADPEAMYLLCQVFQDAADKGQEEAFAAVVEMHGAPAVLGVGGATATRFDYS
eukprot:gene32457-41184_t